MQALISHRIKVRHISILSGFISDRRSFVGWVANAELISITSPTMKIVDPREASYTSLMVTKIIDNMQISIKNIHVRYEDEISNPLRPFSAGITLNELSVKSESIDPNEVLTVGEQSQTRKLLNLVSLSIYWVYGKDAMVANDEVLASKLVHEMVPSISSISSGRNKLKVIIVFTDDIFLKCLQFPKDTDDSFASFVLSPVSGSGKVQIAVFYFSRPDNS
jgi:hypothetical protein